MRQNIICALENLNRKLIFTSEYISCSGWERNVPRDKKQANFVPNLKILFTNKILPKQNTFPKQNTSQTKAAK